MELLLYYKIAPPDTEFIEQIQIKNKTMSFNKLTINHHVGSLLKNTQQAKIVAINKKQQKFLVKCLVN